MANLILSIGFLEANATEAINMLCDTFGLPRSEPNAQKALKRLAVRRIREQQLINAQLEAESKPLPE